MKLATIRKKARANVLEVEHILAAGRKRVPGLQQELMRLSDELGWSPTPFSVEGEHVVPLAKWARVAGAYAEGGIATLTELAGQQENRHYVVAMLVEVRTQEAAVALFDRFADVLAAPSWDCEVARDLVDALNSLFFFSKPLIPTDEQAATARSFLMTLYSTASTTTQRAHVLCALRGVGDRSTIEFMSTLEALPDPYEGVVKGAIRAIRNRLRVRE
jgi:hypothetical protein